MIAINVGASAERVSFLDFVARRGGKIRWLPPNTNGGRRNFHKALGVGDNAKEGIQYDDVRST